jgi:hypothetical protein
VNQDYSDGEIVMLQTATVGNGINIVMMGDGYTDKHMARGTGKYERDMRAAADHFFSVYPYTEYRDHFNVYMVVAESREEGISVKSTNTWVDTKFEAVWAGGRSTVIECNKDIVIDYLLEIPGSEDANINDVTVIMLINADIDAGTCRMMYYYDNEGDFTNFGNGFSISMCPTGRIFKEVVVHEAGGHGFSKVTDEYFKEWDGTVSEYEKEEYRQYKTLGWCENVDFYDDILQTSWKGFAGMSKYSMVGTFEGADEHRWGIWRPEYNSCMNDNVLYFNAQTRWAQVRRIKRLAGFDYSFEQFLRDDVVPAYPSMVRSGGQDGREFVPFAPPVMKIVKGRPRKK